MIKETVIQFGEGNFLRGFADDFLDMMNRQGLYEGRAVIVKPTPRGNLDKFTAQNCRYHLVLRGMENGQAVSRTREIASVSRCVNPYTDFDAYLALAANPDFRIVISNTTEAGIAYDECCRFTDRPALSFPGKLTQLLYERFRLGLRGFVLLPCELIDDNGGALKRCVLQYARLWELGEDFARWIETENVFCNTLVDRIVTGFPKEDAADLCKEIGCDDLLLDTAEPYHLWAVEGDFESEFPLQRAGINAVWTDDIAPLKKRKVRLLNGAHTVTVFPALLCGVETVGDCLKDPQVCAFLQTWLRRYALPVLGETPDNEAFAAAVLERFANPYIRHLLASIALNSVSKFAVRVAPTAADWHALHGDWPRPAALSLAALIYYYKNRQPQDDPALIAQIREGTVEELVKSGLWGADLSGMLPDVLTACEMIEAGRVREGLVWAIS